MRDNHRKKKVLHISTHLGGGVGRVLINYLLKANAQSDYEHKVFCLDQVSEKKRFIELGIKIEDCLNNSIDIIFKEIEASDIIVIHWWNHPMIYNFLIRNELPSARVIFWSHVAGSEAPQVFTQSLLDYPDVFVFTTPISYTSPEVLNYKGNREKIRSIWSTGGLEHIKDVKAKQHEGFNVGYIGTVDYIKLYPNVIDLCSRIKIPNIKFYFCGGDDEKILMEEVQKRGLQDKFIFTGHVKNINDYLSIFDLFGYPLSKNHYGTCDQALAEAMGVGLVPIVFDNKMECNMVENGVTGIIAKNEEDYIQAIQEIYENSELKEALSKKTKEVAMSRFSLEKTFADWEVLFLEILSTEKSCKKWSGEFQGKEVAPHEIFLESIGPYKEIFKKCQEEDIKSLGVKSHSWKSKTKGTVHHYAKIFRADEKLQQWSALME